MEVVAQCIWSDLANGNVLNPLVPEKEVLLWLPYACRELAYQVESDELWRAVTPMICVDCIAWHHPDRCIRQFGFGQRVPQDAELAGAWSSYLG
ncbi:Serine/threonine-protein phosphatase 7 long form homolog [Linum perenne]